MAAIFMNSKATIGYARTQADADKFNESSNKPVGLTFVSYVLATNDDFSGTADGRFRYIGTDEYVEIPHVIKRVNVTSYKDMFRDTSVKGVISTNKNVTDMSNMFTNSQATSLDLSNFDTSSVIYMYWMFLGSQATSLDLSLFDTRRVTNMNSMFYNSQATSLDLSSFDTRKVQHMSYMFENSQATSLDLSSFNTSSLTSMTNTFRDTKTTSLDLSSFDTRKVTDMSNTFVGSQATIGYARTQTDADKFNSSSNKPTGLTFIVKE